MAKKDEQPWMWQLAVMGATFLVFPCVVTTIVYNLVESQFVNFLTFSMFGLMAFVGLKIAPYMIFGRQLFQFIRRSARGEQGLESEEPAPAALFVVLSSIGIALSVGTLAAWLSQELNGLVPVFAYGFVGLLFGLLLRYIVRHDIID